MNLHPSTSEKQFIAQICTKRQVLHYTKANLVADISSIMIHRRTYNLHKPAKEWQTLVKLVSKMATLINLNQWQQLHLL